MSFFDLHLRKTGAAAFIRGGSAGAALYTFRQPGIYAFLTHNLIEAVELGATAHFKVDGPWNDDLMTQVKPPGPIPSEAGHALLAPDHAAPARY